MTAVKGALTRRDHADGFNLRRLVRDVVESSTVADPGLLATEVLSRIAKADEREALVQSLRHFVRQVLSEDRSRTRMASVVSGGSPAASWKVRDRQAWLRSLRDRVHVGDSQWKLLGECTADDLAFAAQERDEQASRHTAKAREYRELARLVSEHDAKNVRALPTDVLARVFGRAA